MKEFDYIIVGQGIAGSVIAQKLLSEGQKILVIDEDRESTSSKIAAGLCNPVVFKRLTRSWMVDIVMPVAKEFYRNQELMLGGKYFYDLPIYKLFADKDDQNYWKRKCNEPELFNWLDSKIDFPFDPNRVVHPFGAAHVLNSGFLITSSWLSDFKEYLIGKDLFESSVFDYDDMKVFDKEVHWKSYKAKKIIFCEGYQTTSNPYFNWLPFKPTKGEVLTVTFNNLKLDVAINKGVFILPYGGNYKLGSTYEWKNLDNEITEDGRNTLLQKASKFIDDEIDVISQYAAVRPTVMDRRPLLGCHPKYSNLVVFNGLGTKGVMLAPYYAEVLTKYLLKNDSLPDEVNISRFHV